MNDNDAKALQDFLNEYNRDYMFDMLRERKEIIDEAMKRIDEEEAESEAFYFEDLVAMY